MRDATGGESMREGGDFFIDTEPVPDAERPGRYRCTLGDDWRAFYLFGGATLAATVRAASAHVDRAELQPVGLHAVYLRPVEPGPLVIDVETLRAARNVHQLAATLRRRDGDLAVRMQGTWGSHEPDVVTGLGVRCPDVPGPDDPAVRPSIPSPQFGHLPINARFEERHCPGSGVPGAFVDPDLEARSMVWTRLAGGHDGHANAFDAALLALYADRVPGPHLGPTIVGHPTIHVPPRVIVTLELALRIVGTPVTSWVLLEGSIAEAAGRYVTVRAHMWDEDRRLVAFADQTARFASTVVTAPEVGPMSDDR